MKYFSLISAILLSLTSVNVLADKYICKHLEGHLAPLRFDPECHIKYEKPDHFPDVTFFSSGQKSLALTTLKRISVFQVC